MSKVKGVLDLAVAAATTQSTTADPPIEQGALANSTIFDEQTLDSKAVAEVFSSPDAQLELGDPPLLTRTQKQARKGLPEYKNLLTLARVWLENAHELWPDIAKACNIPPVIDATVEQLAQDFQRRFITGQAEPFQWHLPQKLWKALAAGYLRYSDDNSNPRSLDDQLAKEMHRAKDDGRFLPWEFVFADASVTGRTFMRRGYRLAKDAVEKFRSIGLDTLYIDDFGRATRNAIETYRLATLMERLRLRLIGVSDGFDLSSSAAKIQIMAAAMFNEMFIDQLKAKVLRGMKGAAKRGTVLGKLRFGYKLMPLLDKNGHPVINTGKNTIVNIPAKDPDALEWVNKAARWFAEDLKSYAWIARQFNANKVGGRIIWHGSQISQMLACPLYIGVIIFNRLRAIFDPETCELSFDVNPRSEWVVKVVPELRAWDDELWKKVRRRAAYIRECSPCTGRKIKRSEIYPVALLLGTLVCGSCGRELQLIRSDVKNNYRQYGCFNGCAHIGGCQQHSSKSARLVERSVLAYLADKVLTKERIEELVTLANKHLLAEAKKPKVPIQPLKAHLQDFVAQEQELMDFVMVNKAKHDMSGYLKKGDELRKKIVQVQAQIRQAEAANAAPPAPMDASEVLAYLSDMQGLLNQNVEKSAPLLRALVGKITVREIREPGKHWVSWVGQIQTDLVSFMAKAARLQNYPFTGALELLMARRWIKPVNHQFALDLPDYAYRAPTALALYNKTKNVSKVAAAMGLTWSSVRTILDFAQTGERPTWPARPGKRNNRKGKGKELIPKWRQIADDVARLKDQEKMSFPAIVKWLGENRGINVAVSMAHYAWDRTHQDLVRVAVERGECPKERSRHYIMSYKKHCKIRELLRTGVRKTEIAKIVGCGVRTVYRESKAVQADNES